MGHRNDCPHVLRFSVEKLPVLAVLAGLIFFAEAGNLLEVFSIESEKLFVPSLVLVRPSHDGLGCSKRLSCLESFKSQHITTTCNRNVFNPDDTRCELFDNKLKYIAKGTDVSQLPF